MKLILFDILFLLILFHTHISLIAPILDATIADKNVK